MYKVYCDRCGKEIIDCYYRIDIFANDVHPTFGISSKVAIHNSSEHWRNIFAKEKHYCEDCKNKIESYIKEDVTETKDSSDATGWIDIKERLPDNTEAYLVLTESGDMDIMLFNSKSHLKTTWSSTINKFIYLDSRNDWRSCDSVTHWMPLPEYPSEVKKKLELAYEFC